MFIVVIIILLSCFMYELLYKDKINVPKKIWTYCDNCNSDIEWKKYTDYEIVVLTKKNCFHYINIPVEITSHPNFDVIFSDLVCLYALAEYGGIWIDYSVILKAPLDWLFPKHAEFSGFYIESKTPIIQNKFIACNKSPFIQLWKEEFIKIANYVNVEKYVESRKNMGVNLENIRDPIYQVVQVAAQKVLQIDKYPLDSLILRKENTKKIIF